jgi:hypothetical protein
MVVEVSVPFVYTGFAYPWAGTVAFGAQDMSAVLLA